MDVLTALQDKFEPIKTILARGMIPTTDYNDGAAELHRLAKAGEIARTKDSRGWCFAKAGTIPEIQPGPKDTSGLPSWAMKPVWKSGDGSIPDVWSTRAAHSCYWSCVWAGEGGPETQRPAVIIESMSRAQKFYEIKDNALRGDGEASSLALSLSPMDEDPSWQRWESAVDACLKRLRASYSERASYVGIWALTPRIHVLHQRPGWDHVLPSTEKIARRPDGIWVWLRDLENTLEKGIPLCEPEILRGVSEAEQAQAREALRAATRGW